MPLKTPWKSNRIFTKIREDIRKYRLIIDFKNTGYTAVKEIILRQEVFTYFVELLLGCS